MAYLNHLEDILTCCGTYLPDDQLVPAYIELVDVIIGLTLKESRCITVLKLCRKATDYGETL